MKRVKRGSENDRFRTVGPHEGFHPVPAHNY